MSNDHETVKLQSETKSPLSGIPERDLIRDAIGGSHSAFREIYVRNRDRLYNIIFYSLGDADRAHDVLQTVFLKAYRALPEFRHDARLGTWLCRIALNECTNLKMRARARHVPIEELLGSAFEFDRTGASPDDVYAHAQRSEILQRAVQDLSPKLRSVVVLRYVEGMSYDEMADVLECSAGTVASRLNRALAELQTRLKFLKGLV